MSTSSTGDALLAAVHADRSDLTVRLVYADWLQENDETELAEYIRLECEWLSRPFGDREFPQLAREAIKLCGTQPHGGWEFAEDLERIRGKMDQLREADPDLELRGAREHQYKILPPIPEADLLDFEARLGFPLPADYRAFHLRVCNGPIATEEFVGRTPLQLDCDLERLQRPFPLTRDQLAASDDGYDWLKDHENVEDGWLRLNEFHYVGFAGLVIHGETRGCIMGSNGFEYFVDEPPVGISFLQWYEKLLDESLRQCTRND